MSPEKTPAIVDSAAHLEATRLEECPRCDYSLQSRENETTCPECGLVLDRNWEVFRVKRAVHPRYWPFLGAIFCLLILGVTVFAIVSSVSREGWPASIEKRLALVAPACAAPILALIVFYFLRRGMVFIAVGPYGIALGWSDGAVHMHEWRKISNIRAWPWMGTMRFDTDRFTSHQASGIFGRRMRALLRAIERHRPGN